MKAFANHIAYSDINPYEVVRVISDKTIEIRRMKATELPWEKEVHAGGFFAHVSNQSEQKWEITSDPRMSVERIRLRKDGKWYDKHGRMFRLDDKPEKFHDFNF